MVTTSHNIVTGIEQQSPVPNVYLASPWWGICRPQAHLADHRLTSLVQPLRTPGRKTQFWEEWTIYLEELKEHWVSLQSLDVHQQCSRGFETSITYGFSVYQALQQICRGPRDEGEKNSHKCRDSTVPNRR